MFCAKFLLLFFVLTIVNCDDDDYIQNEENNVEEFSISVSSIIISPNNCPENYRWIRGQCREII